MYCIYGNSSWYINGGPLFGGGPLLGGSVIGGFTVYVYFYIFTTFDGSTFIKSMYICLDNLMSGDIDNEFSLYA